MTVSHWNFLLNRHGRMTRNVSRKISDTMLGTVFAFMNPSFTKMHWIAWKTNMAASYTCTTAHFFTHLPNCPRRAEILWLGNCRTDQGLVPCRILYACQTAERWPSAKHRHYEKFLSSFLPPLGSLHTCIKLPWTRRNVRILDYRVVCFRTI